VGRRLKLPVSLLKQLTDNQKGNQDSVLEVSGAKSLEKMADKVVNSPTLKKGEARCCAICALNPFYKKVVDNLLIYENLENGESTKTALAGLDKVARALGNLSSREKEHRLLGFLNKG
jgi:translation initiation factor IF-2